MRRELWVGDLSCKLKEGLFGCVKGMLIMIGGGVLFVFGEA